MLYWYLFFFVTVGAKLILATVTIYFLIPTDRRCSRCDEETLLMRVNRVGRVGSAMTGGRVRWRWCPRCGWEGLARHVEAAPSAASTAGSAAPTRR